MEKNKLIIFFLLTGLIILNTCEKLEKEMMVSTGAATNFLINSADVTGVIVDLGKGAIQYGHCYATAPNVTIDSSKTQFGAPIDTGGFTSRLANLKAGTKYYIKAYLSNGNKTVYGKEINFSTVQGHAPTITTSAIASVTNSTASGGGDISSDGGSSVTARGVCWCISQNPTTADNKTTDGSGKGVFTSSLTELQACTQYNVRAYTTNQYGTGYGNEINFTTKGTPSVTTTSVTSITNNSATSGGDVTNDCGSAVTARGVCWSMVPNPITADNITADGSGTGAFSSNLAGLQSCTVYYVRAYATNLYGTVYGNEINFSTYGLPTVTTTSITDVTNNSATSGGNVTSDCGSTVSARGVCWSTSPSPTIDGSKTIDHKFTGVFTSSLAGLQSGTIYFVRAYATNQYGTVYGNEVSFTTNP
jgi:hypothetical protein